MTKEDHQLVKLFLENNTKGSEKRKVIYDKISQLVLDLIEKKKHLDMSEEKFKELLSQYVLQANFFGDNKRDIKIFSYFILAYSTKENLCDIAEVDIIDLYALLGERKLLIYRQLAGGIFGI